MREQNIDHPVRDWTSHETVCQFCCISTGLFYS